MKKRKRTSTNHPLVLYPLLANNTPATPNTNVNTQYTTSLCLHLMINNVLLKNTLKISTINNGATNQLPKLYTN